MKRILLPFLLFCIIFLAACDKRPAQNPAAEQAWSYVYAPTEITLPDGWYFNERPQMSYDGLTGTLTVDVHYELPPIGDIGFIPFIYGTATLTPDGTLLSIQSDNEDEVPSVTTDAQAMTDVVSVKPQHDGAAIWNTKTVSDGTLLAVEALYTDHDAGLWLTAYDAAGTQLFSITPADLFGYDMQRDIGAGHGGGEIFALYDMASLTDSQGEILYALLTSEGLAAVHRDGTLAWVSDVRTIRSMIQAEDGGLLLLCDAGRAQNVIRLNPDNGHAAETLSLDPAMTTDGDSITLFSGGDGGLYAKNRRGIWSLTPVTDECGVSVASAALRLDFALSEIAQFDASAVAALDETAFFFALTDENSDETARSRLYRYDYVLPEDVIVKEEIVLARLGTHEYLETVVRDFNKSSDTHRIVIRDYTGYADADARKMALDTDIASGDIPDLFLIGGGIGGTDTLADIYAGAGVFADLKPVLSDIEAKRHDRLLGCVTAPFETALSDGAAVQYLLPLSYGINTYVGHKEDFGDTAYAAPTAGEMLNFYRSVPDDRYIMQNCYDLQRYLLLANIDGYYDRNTAVCTFADGDLAALMEGSQSIYDSAEYLGENESTAADFHDDFRAGTLRLQRIGVRGLPGWVHLQRALGDFTPVGYPNREGRHYASIHADLLFAMSSQTQYTAEITEFLTLWFSHNAAQIYESTPLFSGDIDAALALYADQTFIENGENTGFVHDNFADAHPGLKYKLTASDADSYRAFLDAIDARVRTDTPAAEIFWEEFYDRGGKAWNTVMVAAQSRCAIYLSEQHG